MIVRWRPGASEVTQQVLAQPGRHCVEVSLGQDEFHSVILFAIRPATCVFVCQTDAA
jgi:hypothetical protein